ncbi:uncharacterized protein K02A2.6-like [Astatotilapia calliptera]|uniref:uncharacterized protein K02A2.6-like n=1 Tax=Astatotilapia calliptera TaxID=8154 RepID=UPI000E3FE5F8|nr:uncharacterized protein K02A2.6-like [Astatotilapia calliptera]
MAMHVGRVEEYNESKEDFESYLERLEQWMLANDVSDEKKVCTFLSVIGADTYRLLKNLVSPRVPSTMGYAALTGALSAHYKPTPVVIAERFRFQKRNQKEGEAVSDYVVALRQLSATCDFGQYLDEALRDRFVSGLRSDAVQRKLLSEKDLTFPRACEIAVSMELASKNTMEFSGRQDPHHVNALTNAPNFFNKGWKGQNRQEGNNKPKNWKGPKKDTGMKQPCYRCGGKHSARECKFRSEKCHVCAKIGHIARACRNKKFSQQTQYLETEDECSSRNDEAELFGVYSMYSITSSEKGYTVDVVLGSKNTTMLLDTGSAVSVVSDKYYQMHLTHFPIKPASGLKLKSYSGQHIAVRGYIMLPVQYGTQNITLPLIVVQGDRPALIGRNWLKKLQLNWKQIFTVHKVLVQKEAKPGVLEVIQRHQAVFSDDQGCIKGFKARIHTKPNTTPIFCKARPVPYALKEAVEKELDRLEKVKVISKVEKSEWASPIVTVPKADKTIRICGDYKVSVNQCVEEERYPLPNTEDLFATLAGGTSFSKLDLSHAYQQLQLDEESEKYLVINTHKGLYKYNRLSYGVSSAPALFQSVMDQILQGMEHVTCFLDDILITASSERDHLKRLEEVLTRLEKHGVRVKLSKCHFLQSSVEYLGHRIDRDGLHPLEEKVAAIANAPEPTNVTELKSFLGLLNYYSRFLENPSTILQPLHNLLRKDAKWIWTMECAKAFRDAKSLLLQNKVLVHYSTNLPLKLACDASPYGLGAVISHVMENGEERPVAFASRTLTEAERKYAQIEKEALAIIFGVKKFHKYLYGRKFTLITDHKPLLAILGPKSAVPTLAALRMQRWALILMAYNYDIEYRRSAEHANADALSRLPRNTPDNIAAEGSIFYFSHVEELPIVAKDIERATMKDPILSKVWSYTMNGWPSYMQDESLKPYFTRRHELSAEQGCVLWGQRVIIPPVYQQKVLEDLHHEHPGICRMKALARSYLWWPGCDGDIQELVQSCSVCQAVQKSPPVAPLHPWKWPERVWQRIHIDFAEKGKQYFLVVIDSHSKWLEVFPMPSITSHNTIEVLRGLFASYGLPEELVSDNGPQLVSKEFNQFLELNGIRHTAVPAYHPASNGAAERSVQILKRSLMKNVLEADGKATLPLSHRLANFLIMYRSTPHTVTGRTPAELFLKRQIRTRFSLLKPELSRHIEQKQSEQKRHHDYKTQPVRVFSEGDAVRIRNFRGGETKWTQGTVLKKMGSVTYLIQEGQRTRTIHVDHLLPWRQTVEKPPVIFSPVSEGRPEVIMDSVVPEIPPSPPGILTSHSLPPEPPKQTTDEPPVSNPETTQSPSVERRYPERRRVPPKRLNL